MKPLPVSTADFRKIREEGFAYLDKTEYFSGLLAHSGNYFLSRPRRFGKSLTISTLYWLLKGEKELFKGTYIYDKWDFRERPVIRLDMSLVRAESLDSFKECVVQLLKENFKQYNLTPTTNDYGYMFMELINQLYDKMGPVAILVDEYDKPILDHILEPDKMKTIRQGARDFYVYIKALEEKLCYSFVFGLTKSTKTGMFSVLNNLEDLSTQPEYAGMFGFTEQELVSAFKEHIDATAQEMAINSDELMALLKFHYNGYSFDGRTSVYNPYSMTNFFKKRAFENFWFESGTSDTLIAYGKTHDLNPDRYIHTWATKLEMAVYDIETAPTSVFLLQSGYLTFKQFDKNKGYLIGYPNHEVKNAFSMLLLQNTYSFGYENANSLRDDIYDALDKCDFDALFAAMQRCFAGIPGKLYPAKKTDADQKERWYHTIMLTLFWASGIDVTPEEWTSHGISDLVLKYKDAVYIIELKRQVPDASIQQIRDKGYANKYASSPHLTLAGIELDVDKRKLKSCKTAGLK